MIHSNIRRYILYRRLKENYKEAIHTIQGAFMLLYKLITFKK